MSERYRNIDLSVATEPEAKPSPGTGYEPFDSPHFENNLFRNGYGGNFANRMELNRKVLERFCRIVNFDGAVHLSTMSQPRTLSYDALGNVLIMKGGLVQPSDSRPKKENPLSEVTSVPQGWNIAINDQELTRQVSEKRSDIPVEDRFISRFNALLKAGLSGAARRELTTSERHPELRTTVLVTLFDLGMPFIILGDHFKDLPSIIEYTFISSFFALGNFGIANLLEARREEIHQPRRLSMRRMETPRDLAVESLRPPVPIDNLALSKLYMSTKGKSLVRKAT